MFKQLTMWNEVCSICVDMKFKLVTMHTYILILKKRHPIRTQVKQQIIFYSQYPAKEENQSIFIWDSLILAVHLKKQLEFTNCHRCVHSARAGTELPYPDPPTPQP